MSLTFFNDEDGNYWATRLVRKVTDGAHPRATLDDGTVVAIAAYTCESLLDMGPVVPAEPGYTVWQWSRFDEDDPSEVGRVVAWVIAFGKVVPVSDVDGLANAETVVVRRPDGAFVYDGCVCADIDELRPVIAAVRNLRRGKVEPSAKTA